MSLWQPCIKETLHGTDKHHLVAPTHTRYVTSCFEEEKNVRLSQSDEHAAEGSRLHFGAEQRWSPVSRYRTGIRVTLIFWLYELKLWTKADEETAGQGWVAEGSHAVLSADEKEFTKTTTSAMTWECYRLSAVRVMDMGGGGRGKNQVTPSTSDTQKINK